MLREGKPIVSSRPPIEGRAAKGLARRMAGHAAEEKQRSHRPPEVRPAPRTGGLAALGRAVRALLAPARPH